MGAATRAGAGVTDDERIALATLLRVAEPGAPSFARWVRERGPQQALAEIEDGASAPGVDHAALLHRLKTASGERDLERAAAVGARLVTPEDVEWPGGLDDLQWVDRDCLGLWVRGPLPLAKTVERAVREQKLSIDESRVLLKFYENGLEGYTYLE